MTIGLLHTTIRGDEKLLIQTARKLKINLEVIDVRQQIFNPDTYKPNFDLGLERCVSTVKGLHAVRFLESLGVTAVNSSLVANLCGDKFATSLVLKTAGIPVPKFALAFTEAQVKQAVKQLGGYPVVIKPPMGSWGRLLARVTDNHALEALIEHKEVLGSPQHKAYYIQEYIRKPGRDIRVTVAGNKVLCAIYRQTKHWITNTARGAQAKPCPLDKNLIAISRAAAKVVGGGILGIDVFETKTGYVVNEVNHTTEFKNVQRVTGVDVAAAMLKYCLKIARKI